MTLQEYKKLKRNDVVIYHKKQYVIRGHSVQENYPYFYNDAEDIYLYIRPEHIPDFEIVQLSYSLKDFL